MALISYIGAIFFALAFLADRLPLLKAMGKISTLGKMALKTINAGGMQDDEKQKRLLANSAALFKQSAILAALVILVLIAGYLLVLAGDFFGIVKIGVLFADIETLTGALISVLTFCFYFLLKKIYARARL